MKGHAKRGEMARKKRLFAQVYAAVEILIVTGCQTVADLRKAHSEGRFENAEWLKPAILPMLVKHRDLTKVKQRTILNSLANDYEKKIVKLLAESDALPKENKLELVGEFGRLVLKS